MEENDIDKKKLEELKLQEEVRQLKTQNKHSRIKLFLSIIGATVLLVGLFIDRINTKEQRKYEFEKIQLEKKTERMIEIASNYNQMFDTTVTVLAKNRTRTWQLIVNVGMLSQAMRDYEPQNSETRKLKEYIDSVYSNLADQKASVDEWADAISLEYKWESIRKSPTPDFEQLFGNEILTEWTNIPELAISALNAEYSLRGTHSKEKLEKFREEGRQFQSKLYKRINEMYEKE